MRPGAWHTVSFGLGFLYASSEMWLEQGMGGTVRGAKHGPTADPGT